MLSLQELVVVYVFVFYLTYHFASQDGMQEGKGFLPKMFAFIMVTFGATVLIAAIKFFYH